MILHAKGIHKRFGKRSVLAGFDLVLERGQVGVLLGANGAGKSTFLRLALGMLKPDAGEISVCGFDPVRRPALVRKAVGYVPDRPDAYSWMTVRDLFRFLRPQYPTWNDGEADRLVEALRVPPKTPFRSLSRGEGMKAMLCAALAPQPELLLLDEPFAGLDPLVREEVLRGVIAQLRAGETSVLCVTHDLDVAARIADRVAILSGGRVVREGALAEVLPAEGKAPEQLLSLLAEVNS